MKCLNRVLDKRPDHFEATFLTGLIQQRKALCSMRRSASNALSA